MVARGVATEVVCVFCWPSLIAALALLLRLSVGCHRSWLVEHGAYELGLNMAGRHLVWYLFMLGAQVRSVVFTINHQPIPSIESLSRNARWLEREVGEMHDLWYRQKRDRRALFLVPLLYWAPLRRAFPVSGFYDLRLAVGSGRLYAYHITWLD